MNRRLIIVVALILGAVGVQNANACVMLEGARTNPAWQAEYEALGNQFGAVGALWGYDGSSWYNAASAVKIADNWLLTAGHAAEEGGVLYQEYAFASCTGRAEALPEDVFYGGQATLHPEYTREIVSPDLALLYFPDGLGDVPIAERFRGTDRIGELLTMVGYGVPGYPSTGWLSSDGKRRGWQAYLDQFGGTWIGAPEYQALALFTDLSGLHLNGLGSGGHSGGGMFNDDGELMGIIGFVNGINYGAHTGGTRLSLYNDWIDTTIASIPEPATFGLLLFGGLALLRRHQH